MNSFIYNKNSCISYCEKLVGKVMKILFLSEEDNNTVPHVYLYALIIDASSANSMFNDILIDVIVKLNALYMLSKEPISHSVIRSRVLECANMVDRIKKELLLNG